MSTTESKTPRVLLVDDDADILSLMHETLTGEGYEIVALSNPAEVVGSIDPGRLDAIVTDIHMPHLSGIELLKEVKKRDADVPVIMVTGFADLENLMTSFRLGAFDYLKKPFSMNELIITVAGAVEKRSLKRRLDRYYQELEERVKEKTHELVMANRRIEENLLSTILAMVNAIEASDIYTRGHSERVTTLSLMLGEAMGLDNERMKVLRLGAVLHDVGKIGVTHAILNKPDVLTDDEYDLMKEHPRIGVKIIEPIDFDHEVFAIVGQHHERVNGEGYPHGLAGGNISPLARIVAVADAYDAITSHRPYRAALPPRAALQELQRCAGVQFDSEVVQALESIFPELQQRILR